MGKFNLNEYDDVAKRIKDFYTENADGRITTRVLFQDGNRTMIKAFVYMCREDQEKKCPRATGIAEEERMGKQKTKEGGEYEPVNFSSWTENCETSAIGRALANMNMSGNKRPSRQEMEKVQRYSNIDSANPSTTTAPQNGQGDVCSKCGDEVTDKVAKYSKEKFGKVLCFDCQKLN